MSAKFTGLEQPYRSLDNISIVDLRRRIRSLRKADLRTLSDTAASFRIRHVIDQYMFQVRHLQLTGIYRARLNRPGELFSTASQLWYPPIEAVLRPSRLNGIGQVRFYASSTPNTAVFELRPKTGHAFTVLLATTSSRQVVSLNVAFIGLERSLAPEVQHFTDKDSFRRSPTFRERLGSGNYKKWLLIDDYLSEIFGAEVPDGEEHLYKLTIALAKLLFEAPGVDAVSYPSVATSDHGINVCMNPAAADRVFAPLEAWVVEVGEKAVHPQSGMPLWRVQFIRTSQEIGPDGSITWRPPGEGIDQSEIMRFARRRMEALNAWPKTSAT